MHVKYVHEGAKPYECEQCTKTFVRKEDLARHAVLHTGIKGGTRWSDVIPQLLCYLPSCV
jgi:uncharacterized Zn-finger protein